MAQDTRNRAFPAAHKGLAPIRTGSGFMLECL